MTAAERPAGHRWLLALRENKKRRGADSELLKKLWETGLRFAHGVTLNKGCSLKTFSGKDFCSERGIDPNRGERSSSSPNEEKL